MSDESHPTLEWARRGSALNWLVWSLDRARQRAYRNDQLVSALRYGFPKVERGALLDEIERRIQETATFQESIVDALAEIFQRHSRPGPAAQEADRLLRRLLWQLSGQSARRLALSCAESRRLQRRIAAWRFYATHGLDLDGRKAVAATAESEYHEHLGKLVAHDAELLELVGVKSALDRTADSYWRGRILETWLAAGHPPPDLVASHPQEALFAIRRAERRDLIPLAEEIFRDNRTDPDVVSAAIQAFGALDLPSSQATAIRAAKEILESVPEPERQWMGLDRALARLASDPLDDPDGLTAELFGTSDAHPKSALW